HLASFLLYHALFHFSFGRSYLISAPCHFFKDHINILNVKPELVLQHCFKQYKLRDLYPKFFFKVKPKSCPHTPEEPSELRSQLDSLVDVEKWLSQKLCTTEQEDRVLENLQNCRAVRKAERKLAATRNLEVSVCLIPLRVIPLINAPYPQSLITLHNLLHKQKLKMVDLFRKADKDKKQFMRSDFIKVIKGVCRKQVKNIKLKFSLTSVGVTPLKPMIRADLTTTASPRFHTRKAVSKTVSRPASAAGKTKETQPLAPSEPGAKLTLLEVPPIDTELDHRPLSYEEMEETGKRCRERKRWEKVNPIQWLECCRLVRSGNKAIDEHCLPSTMESEMGEITDQHRRTCYMVYLQCLKLCKEYNIPLTEKVLEKALLYPGDKIIKEGAYVQKIRQPGGPYTTTDGSHHQRRVLLNRQRLRNALKRDAKNGFVQRVSTVLIFFRRLHTKWSNLNYKSHDNNFWPGHLLDKLRIYLPQIAPNQEHALFSYVRPTPPVYPGVYNPHRSWPISDQGYVTYGNTETQKY
uniref:EF-hand calcium binding domain 12 n=1 Tax=Chelonoidis abingdonii TaxID=106734 RepID=A0A8C0G2L5_CHEAB